MVLLSYRIIHFLFLFGTAVCYIVIATIIIDSPCDYTEDLDQSHTKEYIIASTYIDLWLKCFCVFNTRDPNKSLTLFQTMFITRDSEVLMVSPCVFVCLFVCVCVCHDVCPDDLAMRDWCHTKNMLQLKISEMLMATFLVYSTSGITSGKKSLSRAQNESRFEFVFWNIKHSFNWPEIWKDHPKLCQKGIFHDDDIIDDVTGWPKIRPSIFLYKGNNSIFHIN